MPADGAAAAVGLGRRLPVWRKGEVERFGRDSMSRQRLRRQAGRQSLPRPACPQIDR